MKLRCDFAADELCDSMNVLSRECRYSLHVIGLLFDGRHSTVYLCDPNGSLLPGGNMCGAQRHSRFVL
jgi:hypothetical protein